MQKGKKADTRAKTCACCKGWYTLGKKKVRQFKDKNSISN